MKMVKCIEQHCSDILENSKCSNLPFHNIIHTQEVVQNVSIIGKELDIDKEELEPVLIAAWFHDTGFSEVYNGHEEVSIKLANEFLKMEGYNSEEIKEVTQCIEATKMPHNPETELAKILCDADLFHVSPPNFFLPKAIA